jgi:hypothetical protein
MRALAALLLLPLAACGEEGPKVTVNGRPVSVPTGASGLPSGLPSGAALDALKAANEKAAALGARALTAQDMERFLSLKAAMTAAGADADAQEAALKESGLSLQEWRVLGGRVTTLVFALQRGLPNEKLAADMETAKPYLERLQAAMKAK